MELNLWRIETRGVGLTKSDREKYCFNVATSSTNESSALKLAKAQYSESWWDDNIITDIVAIGRLKAAEGLEVPKDEIDY